MRRRQRRSRTVATWSQDQGVAGRRVDRCHGHLSRSEQRAPPSARNVRPKVTAACDAIRDAIGDLTSGAGAVSGHRGVNWRRWRFRRLVFTTSGFTASVRFTRRPLRATRNGSSGANEAADGGASSDRLHQAAHQATDEALDGVVGVVGPAAPG